MGDVQFEEAIDSSPSGQPCGGRDSHPAAGSPAVEFQNRQVTFWVLHRRIFGDILTHTTFHGRLLWWPVV